MSHPPYSILFCYRTALVFPPRPKAGSAGSFWLCLNYLCDLLFFTLNIQYESLCRISSAFNIIFQTYARIHDCCHFSGCWIHRFLLVPCERKGKKYRRFPFACHVNSTRQLPTSAATAAAHAGRRCYLTQGAYHLQQLPQQNEHL